MRKNYIYPKIYKTKDEEKTARSVKEGFSSVLKRNVVLVSLLTASLMWCSDPQVRAEEESTEEMSVEETGTEEVNETDRQSLAQQVEDYINSIENGENGADDESAVEHLEGLFELFQENSSEEDQSLTEQVEDFIKSIQDSVNEANAQSLTEQVEDLLTSIQDSKSEAKEQAQDFIQSFLNKEKKADKQSITEQVEDFVASIQNMKEKADNQSAAELVEDIPTTQYFTGEPVAEEDIETILTAGINSPSAMNGQPWHFSAVTDPTILQQIADDMDSSETVGVETLSAETDTSEIVAKASIADAPLAIIISCAEGSELDAGLACQAMSIEAQLLGYGTKIISSPVAVLNGENQEQYKELLEIPEDYFAVAILLVGYEDTSIDDSTDGYTSATNRNTWDEMVTYVEP